MLNRPFAFALSLAFLGFILFFSPAMAEGVKDKITLAYGVVEGFIEADGSGPGAELKNEVVARLEQRGYEVKTPLWPFKRVLVAFQHGKVDLAFPIVSDGGYAKSGFAKWGFKKIPLYSAPVYNGGKFVIYTAKDQPKLNRVNEIGQKLVGVFAGAFIPSELVSPTTYRTIEVKPGEQAFEMLRRGRMDAFLVQDYWGSSILAANPVDGIHHGESFGDVFGSFISQQTERGASLLAEINQIIGALIVDGTYDRILNTYPNSHLLVRGPGR